MLRLRSIASAWLVVSLFFPLGCSSPNKPSGGSLPLAAGPQLLQMTGYSASIDQTLPPCTPPAVPKGGTRITTTLVLSQDGQDWVARSGKSADGDIAIRFHGTGATNSRGSLVEGSATGSQVDTGYPSIDVPHGVRLFIDGTATVDAVVEVSGYTSGTVRGTFRYVDTNDGSTGNCSALTWSIQIAR